ncbi:hypothetical protein TBLA_0A09060 [Henningerozyma blattae CBS 6284]|uniref:Uncharacterized protein n=1 Tax=Henningerozyma blattae (strain ATCC 34711 / CBS 6284 / DSM 70876 / NBRC 10599 / NRRL Y-10934 / UCD 77-7) TaxID=1071380 RepID=I2GX42_HENB6|nr:hypothetical protein TBLA_0A09060 [Tetrapisispora blattae CBS 6284]CCH58694.1 hypothetical protein TBLA_0A09060 [Tetrapisispora blattae CBS 6284]
MKTDPDHSLLDIFFDKDFLPQAYIDILLNQQELLDFEKNEVIINELIGELNKYNREISRELNENILKIESLCKEDDNNEGSNKIEYYMNSLSSSVRNIEQDFNKLDVLAQEPAEATTGIDGIKEYDLIKSRMNEVIENLQEVQNIFQTKNLGNISIETFEDKLNQTQIKSKPDYEKYKRLKGIFKDMGNFEFKYNEFLDRYRAEYDTWSRTNT